MSTIECAICLNNCSTSICQLTQCLHEFCEPCITTWLKKSNLCPMDRSKIIEMFIYNEPGGDLINHLLVLDPDVRNFTNDFLIPIENGFGMMNHDVLHYGEELEQEFGDEFGEGFEEEFEDEFEEEFEEESGEESEMDFYDVESEEEEED